MAVENSARRPGRNLGRSTVRNHRFFLPIAILVLCGNGLVSAQTPQKAIDYYNHGTTKCKSGELDEAIEDFTKAIQISSHLTPAPPRGNAFTDADADKITVIDPFTADVYSNRGYARYANGDLDGAITDFDLALRINPRMAATYLDRGVVRHARGDAKGALADWNRAIEIDDHLAEGYANRGQLRGEIGDIKGSLADLNLALSLYP